MATSFPYLTFARKERIPYATVLHYASVAQRCFEFGKNTPTAMMCSSTHELAALDGLTICDRVAIETVVRDELARRRAVQ